MEISEDDSWEKYIVDLSDLQEDYLTEIIMDNISKKMSILFIMHHHCIYGRLLSNEALMENT